jgi:glycosyltransferase involved in cell wall biosynthesis
MTPAFADAPFDVVHVFRLGTVPAARPFLSAEPPPGRWLDLDDVESATLRRIAALYRQRGDLTHARTEESAANAATQAERETLPFFDRLYVCTAGDIGLLPEDVRARVVVLPNVLPIPEPLPPVRTGDPVEILFVGTLGYFPNADGIAWFAEEVLPLIRRRTGRRVVLRIVGAGFSPLVARLRTMREVEVVGYVPDLRQWYARGRLVVVPIRAGGGTRIKVLEAFALRRPVVATTIGAEGIDGEHGTHLLLTDDPMEFAACCLSLIERPELGEFLAANAYARFSDRYTLEALAKIVAAATASPPR